MANAKIDTKEAVKEINNLIEQFNLLIKATGDVSTISKANFRKVETALEGLRKVAAQSNSTFDKLNDAQKRAALAANDEANALRKTTTELKNTAKAANDAAISQDKLEKNTKKTTSAFGGLLKGTFSLLSAFGLVSGLQIFASLMKNAYDLTKQFNSLSFALKTITKDMFDAAISNRFLMEITEDFGVNLVSTTERWIKFLAASKQAGVSLKDTEQIFRSVTKAGSILGLQTEELQTVYLALEQMMSKGKVTTEELRRQLGEKLPGAVGIMAAAVGVGVNQLDSMLKKGELLSADVLPKFAVALEAAYGIENIDNVETMAAEQNRLTNAWQNFVKSTTENSSAVAGSIKFVGDAIRYMLEALTPQSALDLKDYQQSVIDIKKLANKEMLKNHIETLNKTLDADKSYQAVTKRLAQIAEQQKDVTATPAKLKKLEEEQSALTKLKISYMEKIDSIERDYAEKNIVFAKKKFDNESKIVEDIKKRNWKAFEEGSNIQNVLKFGGDSAVREILLIAEEKKAAAEAYLEIFRLNKEVSKAAKFEPDDKSGKSGRKPATFEIKPVKDLSNEVAISALKNQQELNNELLAGDKASYDERQKAAMDNVGISLDLAQRAYDEEIEKADSYYIKMLDDLEDAIRKGSTIEDDQLKFREDLKKNHLDATLIATQNQNKAVLDVEQKFAEEQLKIAKQVEDDKIAISDSKYNKDIIKAKEVYNASAKTAADQKKLDEALTKAAIEQGNAQIEIRIATLEALLEYGDLTDTQTKDTILLIEKLKASLKTFKPSDDLKEQADKLVEILEFIGEASQAINDLGVAIFDRKIENINAEIEAEKNKYDILIGLAENNKQEQERLQAEKEAKIKDLERKRLKEEQKKAKFEKANAIIQIGISTAVAIMKSYQEMGPIAGNVGAILMGILGAIQIAAVLAKPIPKYKDGLDNAKTDHVAMINDGGKQEFIERDGNILTTSTKNAIVNLKKGDTVHKSYEDLVGGDMFSNLSRSILLNNLYSKNKISEVSNLEKVFDKNLKTLNKDLKEGIRDGFKNVNIHNHTSYDSDWTRYKNDTL